MQTDNSIKRPPTVPPPGDRVEDLTAADIPFGRWTKLLVVPSSPIRSKDELIIRLVRQLAASRRKSATWRDLTQHAIDALGVVTADRDRLRQQLHALLDERRREKAAA